ncbi:DUF3047 domain-containing protein [Desulfotignum balticum]|jgi:hypothetical protein|uniref:DUF3047 domain-containing protein n=1 Tax=Desulfotignum balticum TaxID=115781 RepID=UPI000405FB70|nr:DUF3047 domain-containing protein [Desulfotignum balticum]
MRFIPVLVMVLFLCMATVTAYTDQLVIGNFSRLAPGDSLPDPWEPMTFKNIDRQTSYALIQDNGRTIIRAHSQNSASGLIHPLRVNPEEYPVIKWRWKIDHVLENGDVTAKQGDDYAARIYVAFAFDTDKAGWWERTRHKSASLFSGKELPGTALNYIWANRAPVETIVPNPYAKEARMIVLQSGNSASGRWVTEERNILKDYAKAFGRNPPEIIGIGIMTDTDDTGGETTGYYGDITLLRLPD